MTYVMNYQVFVAFLALLAALVVMDRLFSRRETRSGGKTFACGEDLKHEDMDFATEFSETLARVLKLRYLSGLHSGKLNDYIILMLVGIAISLLVLA